MKSSEALALPILPPELILFYILWIINANFPGTLLCILLVGPTLVILMES